MALTEKQKERIDLLDFSKGGSFSDFITARTKLAPANSKFLFIGLGGKGTDLIASIKTSVYQKIVCDSETKRPRNFQYLAVDTDKNHLNDLERGMFGEVALSKKATDLETCQLYSDASAKLLKKGAEYLPEKITEWFNPMMNKQLTGDGAGGIRQAGRYLLFSDDAFEKVRNTLRLKLETLHNQIVHPDDEKLIVYIFAGVGGGTGSGTIIDIPYIIRKLCEDNGWDVKLYSYIFLQDTYERNSTHIKYNTYAALKEIDTLMNLGHMNGTTRFKATYTTDFSVDSAEPIFDSCVLVSGRTNNGTVPKPDKFTKRVVVDNIINLVTENVTDKGFLANSFLDNDGTEIRNAVSALGKNVPRDARYQYMVIGTGAIVLPIEQILAYIAKETLDKLSSAWDKHPKQEDVERILSDLHVLPQEIANEIVEKSSVPLMTYAPGIGGKVTKQEVINDSLYNTLKNYWMTHNVELDPAWDKAKNLYLSRVIEKLNNTYYEIFKDGNRGVYYLKELIDYTVNEGHQINSLLSRLEDYKKDIRGFVLAQEDRQKEMNQSMLDIKGELEHPIRGALFSGRLIEEYRELCVLKFVSENTIYLYNTLVRNCLNQIVEFLEKKLSELQTYIDVVTYMGDVIERNYNCVMTGKMPYAEYAGKLVDFSEKDETTLRVIQYMDDMLAKKTSKGLVESLARDIVAEEKKWVHSEEDFNPMLVFVNFLENQYKELPNLTLEEFVRLKYGSDGFDIGMTNICKELMNKAKVIFPSDPIISMNSLASHQYVVTPNSALSINEHMEGFASTNDAKVAHSNDMSTMYWYNLVIGVPLFLLDGIGTLEEIYENSTNPGMHCWESKVDNWKNMSTLTNQKLWKTADFNRRERIYMEEVQDNVKAYLESSLIYLVPNGDSKIKIYETICLPDNDSDVSKEVILKWCEDTYLSTVTRDADGLVPTNDSLLQAMKKKFELTTYIVNNPSIYMELTEDNLYQVIRKNIGLYKKLQEMYVIYEECKKMIDEYNVDAIQEAKDRKNLERFCNYVRVEMIQITDSDVHFVTHSGKEIEIIYYEDYPRLDKQFFEYFAFSKFFEMYQEEDLQEFDENYEVKAADRTEEAKARNKKNKDLINNRCKEVTSALNRLDTRRELERAGKAELIERFTKFYEQLSYLV